LFDVNRNRVSRRSMTTPNPNISEKSLEEVGIDNQSATNLVHVATRSVGSYQCLTASFCSDEHILFKTGTDIKELIILTM